METKFTEDEVVNIKDVEYDNNHGKYVSIEVSKEDSKDYLEAIVAERKKIPEFVERTSREQTTIGNALKAVEKCNDYETLIKKLKTLSKYSGDETFPYRSLSRILKGLEFYEEVHYNEQEQMTDEILSKLIVTQTIESLENYSIIHPKIKLLMNLIGKLNPESLEEEAINSDDEGDFAVKMSL